MEWGMMLSCLVWVTCCPNCYVLFNLMASPMSSMEIHFTPLHATSWHLFEDQSNHLWTRIQQKDEQSERECGKGLWKDLSEFCWLGRKNNLKVLLQPVGKYHLVAAILINCHTCHTDLKDGHFLSWNLQHLKHTCPINEQAGLKISHFLPWL